MEAKNYFHLGSDRLSVHENIHTIMVTICQTPSRVGSNLRNQKWYFVLSHEKDTMLFFLPILN